MPDPIFLNEDGSVIYCDNAARGVQCRSFFNSSRLVDALHAIEDSGVAHTVLNSTAGLLRFAYFSSKYILNGARNAGSEIFNGALRTVFPTSCNTTYGPSIIGVGVDPQA